MDRYYLKSLAKDRLRYTMGSALLVALIGGIFGIINDFLPSKSQLRLMVNLSPAFGHWIEVNAFPIILFLLLFAISGIIISGPLSVGMKGWFMRAWRGAEPPVKDVFLGFKMFSSSFTVCFLRDIYIFLWSLLLVIPGIVMSYAYSMAEYIMYENPRLSASQALRMSKTMTQGFKGELFVLDLSFWGWYILSGFTLGILGIVFVNPYYAYTHAAYYDRLKEKALQYGLLRWDEFGQYPPTMDYSANGNGAG